MSIIDIRTAMLDFGNNMYFVYNGEKCGVESEFKNGIPTFEAWCGETTKTYNSFESLITDKFFHGKSLHELSTKVSFDFL